MKILSQRTWFIIIIVLVVINTGALAFILFNHNRKPPNHPDVSGYIIKTLGLNDQQQQTYKSMVSEHRKNADMLMKQVRQNRDQLFHYLKDANVNDTIITRLTEQTGKATAMLDKITFNHFRQLRSICTASQQQKLDEIMQDILHIMAPPGLHRNGPPGDGGPPPGERPLPGE